MTTPIDAPAAATRRSRSSRLALAVPAVLLCLAGTDTVVHAATGASVLAGKVTRAKGATVLKNTGRGPALALRSERGPSLAVSSADLVRRLNADRVDGLDATQLAPVTSRVTVAAAGERLAQRYVRVAVPAGDHLVTLSGLIDSEEPKYCVVMDADRPPGSSPELAVIGDQTTSVSIAAASVVTLSGQDLVVGCTVLGRSPGLALSPVTVTFRPVHGVRALTGPSVPDPLRTTDGPGT